MPSLNRWFQSGKHPARHARPKGAKCWRRRPQVERLEDRVTPSVSLVKDINPLPGGDPANLTVVGNTLFFTAADELHGRELWKSDGTAGGTVLVKDIYPGRYSSQASNLTNVNGTLFFQAFDGVHGFELWKSDGTANGTSMVKDILPGFYSSNPRYLTNVNGTL